MKPVLYIDTAAHLPAVPLAVTEATPYLAAMSRPPPWVMERTHGRPHHAFAEGRREVDYMYDAFDARDNSLFRMGSTAIADYQRVMREKWTRIADTGGFVPGKWRWDGHESDRGAALPPFLRGFVEDGSWLVCTCREGQGCHLNGLAPVLAPWWDVRLYGRVTG